MKSVVHKFLKFPDDDFVKLWLTQHRGKYLNQTFLLCRVVLHIDFQTEVREKKGDLWGA